MQIVRKKSVDSKSIVKIRYLVEDTDEKSLWKAVICQAIEDASSKSKKRRNIYAKQKAFKWIMEDNEDFKAVCDLAGYSYKAVRKNVSELVSGSDNNEQTEE